MCVVVVCFCECQSNKEKSRRREELISTLFLSVERSDGYSYYVNDCSYVCSADPNFAFCVAASFAQRSKSERGLCGCKRLVEAPLRVE